MVWWYMNHSRRIQLVGGLTALGSGFCALAWGWGAEQLDPALAGALGVILFVVSVIGFACWWDAGRAAATPRTVQLVYVPAKPEPIRERVTYVSRPDNIDREFHDMLARHALQNTEDLRRYLDGGLE
jgi:hypothetical protein